MNLQKVNKQQIGGFINVGVTVEEILQEQLTINKLEIKGCAIQQASMMVGQYLGTGLNGYMRDELIPFNLGLHQNQQIPIPTKTTDQNNNWANIIPYQQLNLHIEKLILKDKDNLKRFNTTNQQTNLSIELAQFEEKIKKEFDTLVFDVKFENLSNSSDNLNNLLNQALENKVQNIKALTPLKQKPIEINLVDIQIQLNQQFNDGLLYNKVSKLNSVSLVNKRQQITSNGKQFELILNKPQMEMEKKQQKPQFIYIQNHISYPPKANPSTERLQSLGDYNNNHLGQYTNYQNCQSPFSNVYQSQNKQSNQQFSIHPSNTLYSTLPLQARMQKIQISPPNAIDPFQSIISYNSLQQSHLNETQSLMQSTKVIFLNSKFNTQQGQQGFMMQSPSLHIFCMSLYPSLFHDNEFAIIDDDFDIYLLNENDIYIETQGDIMHKCAIVEFYKFINKLNQSKKNIIFFLIDNNLLRPILQETNKIKAYKPDIQFYQINSLQQIHSHLLSMIQMGLSQVQPPLILNKLYNLTKQIDLMDLNKLLQLKQNSQLYQTLCSFLF